MKRILLLLLAVVVAIMVVGGVAFAKPESTTSKTTPETTSAQSNGAHTAEQVAKDYNASKHLNGDAAPPSELPNISEIAKGNDKVIPMAKPQKGKEAPKSDAPDSNSSAFASGGKTAISSTNTTSTAATSTAPTYVFDWIIDDATLNTTETTYMAGGSQTDINNYYYLYWGHKVAFRVFGSYAGWQAQAAKGWPMLIQQQATMQALCSQEAGGCHTVKNGTPIAYVGQFDTSGSSLSGTSWVANHEAKEMLEDPYINRIVNYNPTYYLAETVDPTQNYSAGYWVAAAPGYPYEYVGDWTTTYFWVKGYGPPYNFRQDLKQQLSPDCNYVEKKGVVQFSTAPNTTGVGQQLTCAAA